MNKTWVLCLLFKRIVQHWQVYWSQPSWCADYSRCSVQQHNSSTTCNHKNASPMCWQRVSEHTQYTMVLLKFRVLLSVCRNTYDLLSLSLTYLVRQLWSQKVPAGWSCYPSNCLLLAAVPFQLLKLDSGSICQRLSSHLTFITTDFLPSIKNLSFLTFINSPDFWLLDWHRYSDPGSKVRYFGHCIIYVHLLQSLCESRYTYGSLIYDADDVDDADGGRLLSWRRSWPMWNREELSTRSSLRNNLSLRVVTCSLRKHRYFTDYQGLR